MSLFDLSVKAAKRWRRLAPPGVFLVGAVNVVTATGQAFAGDTFNCLLSFGVAGLSFWVSHDLVQTWDRVIAQLQETEDLKR